MKTLFNLDDYALNLGKLVSTLQSLEFCLRAFLLEDNTRKSCNTQNPIKYHELKVTDRVAVDAFTNYDIFGRLINKYNTIVSVIDPELVVSESVVDLRDALAHGRIASSAISGNMHLLKFGEPYENQVEVTYSAELNTTWFNSQIKAVSGEIKKIVTASNRLGMQIFSE